MQDKEAIARVTCCKRWSYNVVLLRATILEQWGAVRQCKGRELVNTSIEALLVYAVAQWMSCAVKGSFLVD